MEEMATQSVWILHPNVYKIRVLQTQSPAMFFSLSLTTSERQREYIVDQGASRHMMSKNNLTPEEQETIQKSKGPPVVMTASGMTHTTEEATV